MREDVNSNFEKFSNKKKKSNAYSDKELRFKERDKKRKQKNQSRNPLES